MEQRLMGVETEYAFTALDSHGNARSRDSSISQLMRMATRELTCVNDRGSCSLFLGNGSRLYVDHGLHPELSTPECTNPWDVVRYVKAGDRLLRRVAAKLESEDPEVSEALLFRGNVDYGGTGSTWGCHESYMHRADPSILAEQIIPHLVSRVVFAGAGGFDAFDPGLRFTLSVRAPHMVRVVSGSSTRDRGIFHTKNEPLCDGYHRLHLLCGDSLLSQRALWLMTGSTALVVRLVERGDLPGDPVRLHAPLKALRAFASDPQCKGEARLVRGGPATAIAIQRHYLECVESRAGEESMPSWTEEVCGTWRRTLDSLERDPRGMARTLDWAIKLALYQDRARRSGLDWGLLAFWQPVLEKLSLALDRDRRSAQSLSMSEIVGKASKIRATVNDLTPRLKKRGLTWDDLERFLVLRQELFEVDTRFAQLGDAGIFDALDRSGVLAHTVPGVNRIEQAVSYAPTGSRAHLRGRVIRKLARSGDRDSCVCDWHAVWNQTTNRRLDLSDPFEVKARWKDCPEEGELPFRRLRGDAVALLESLGL